MFSFFSSRRGKTKQKPVTTAAVNPRFQHQQLQNRLSGTSDSSSTRIGVGSFSETNPAYQNRMDPPKSEPPRRSGAKSSHRHRGRRRAKESDKHRRGGSSRSGNRKASSHRREGRHRPNPIGEDEEVSNADATLEVSSTSLRELDPPRKATPSVAIRGNFYDSLHTELLHNMKILLEATFYKQGKVLQQWNKRHFRLENDGSKPILLYWLSPAAAEFQKYNPRGALDLSNARIVKVSPIEIIVENAFDLQKIDESSYPITNKCVSFKLKGGVDAIKSLTDIVENYVQSENESNRKYAAISTRPSTFSTQYELKEELGRGGFAVVYKAVNKQTGEEVAVKQLKLSGHQDPALLERHLKGIESEIKVMSIVTKVFPDNPNLLKLRGVFHEPGERCTYIVMDLMSGGELFDRIVEKSKYTERDASIIFHDMMKALRLLHKVGIVHRDLKPENIIFADKAENSTLKIADFGAAYIVGRENEDIHRGKRIGSPGYFAPEVYRMKYSTACDIFSMGVVLYCMLVGYPPFDAESEGELMMQVITGQFEFHEEHWGGISQEAKDLISKMLTTSPDARPTVDEVLAHPWFSTINDLPDRVRLDATLGRLRQFKRDSKWQSTVVGAFNSTRTRVQQQFMRALVGRNVAKAARMRKGAGGFFKNKSRNNMYGGAERASESVMPEL